MLFSSYEFVFVFLPIMFLGYFYLISKRLLVGSKVWLVAGSLFFYAWWDSVYLPIILGSMFVNYAVGTGLGNFHGKALRLAESGSARVHANHQFSRKAILTFGVLLNLALLGYYKYTDFFIENFNGMFGGSVPLLHIVLPLGISFFTFQQIAYLVDSYHGKTKEYDLLNYMLFITFFPQLIAGPIVHHKELMPQFESRWNLGKRYRNIALGLLIFSIGLFKKVIIADAFAGWASPGFDVAEALSLFQAWTTSLSYTFQLYFDFSGYADMAIGAALLFNIRLPINFNSPYKAISIQDFWRRWHMTLSSFLRDYVYIPLGGNREGSTRTYVNLFATFLIGGFWHGASWMFIIWGALHGAALIVHRLWQQLGFRLWKWLAWLVTFNFINITWVFFRAKEMDDALKVLAGMIAFEDVSIKMASIPTKDLAWLGIMADRLATVMPAAAVPVVSQMALIVCAFVLISFGNTSQRYTSGRAVNAIELFSAAILSALAITFTLNSTSQVFLYFNF
ncbi:MBOAT family protein [Azotobacter chroococcum]|uniref:MBOAT family O-acyltransferase n=1 Tax=Azotobacter chroococcum TaxID=353 RepID=UPI0010388404|nr:MBOAT family protein [Azotobacter chroococcum]TBW39363.1 MBOAT family protein [Azotobacter chroococcum]